MLIPITLAAAAASGLFVHQRRRAAAQLRELERRLPVGADGIIPGAHPIALDAPGPRAVLLLHGFGDTPQTLAYLATAFHGAGFTVRAPLLPGHGRRLDDFRGTRAKEWISAARDAYTQLRASHADVAIVGLSMGGALGIIIAAETPDLPALALVAPYVSMPTSARVVARFHRAWELFRPTFDSGGKRSIHDPAEKERSLAYGFITPGTLFELSRVVRRVQVSLPRVKAPTLVIHGVNDERIPPEAATREYARLGAPTKELVWAERGGHVLTVDIGRDMVIQRVVEWIDRYVPAAPARPGRRRAR